MALYTKALTSPLMPELKGLPEIGSVAANFARTSADEDRAAFSRYSNGSDLSESILSMFGTTARDDYLADVAAYRQRQAAEDQARAIRHEHRRQQIRAFFARFVPHLRK